MDPRARAGLDTYVGLVAAGLGAQPQEALVTVAPPPAWAYLALAERLPHYPEYLVALIWDEHHGWAVAVETGSSEVVPLVWLGADVLPAPWAVVRFAGLLFTGRHPRQPRPPTLRTPGSAGDDLPDRLAGYASEHPRRAPPHPVPPRRD